MTPPEEFTYRAFFTMMVMPWRFRTRLRQTIGFLSLTTLVTCVLGLLTLGAGAVGDWLIYIGVAALFPNMVLTLIDHRRSEREFRRLKDEWDRKWGPRS